MRPLPTCPASPLGDDGALREGLFGGRLAVPPTSILPRAGRRLRRWSYAAAADGGVAVGAAVVDLGYVGAAFAWLVTDEGLLTWEDRRLFGRGCSVGSSPELGATWTGTAASVRLGSRGELEVDLPMGGQRVRAHVHTEPARPASLITATPGGGWNVTEKEAGYPARGVVDRAGSRHELDGGGWRDWTVGRQDRNTGWMWAAGAGWVGGRTVGLNASTGMNGAGPGEDVVWWDGEPQSLEVSAFSRDAETWELFGPGWSLAFRPQQVRAATERMGPVRSRYVQPIGVFSGSLPGPDGDLVTVAELRGVTEEHEARW